MPKELNLTPPLVEAQKMIADFLTAPVINDSDLKRLAQLIEVGQQEIERGNGLRLCVRFFALSECSNLAQCSKAKTDAKPLL